MNLSGVLLRFLIYNMLEILMLYLYVRFFEKE